MLPPVVIIAAGEGSRLRPYSDHGPKSLMELEPGLTIIEHTTRKLQEVGFSRILLVCRRDHSYLFRQNIGDHVEILETDETTHGNLYSVGLALRQIRRGPFILLMSDHLFEEAMLQAVLSRIDKHRVAFTLCLDREPSIAEAREGLKLSLSGNNVVETGKSLRPIHGIDTGVILCGKRARAYIEAALREMGPKASVSDAINLAAKDGKVEYVDVTGRLWKDIDTLRDLQRAREVYWNILRRELSRPEDGIVARLLNRFVSTRVSLTIYRKGIGINPTLITLVGFTVALVAALALASREIMLGGILAQAASIIDGIDGEVARLLRRSSELGRFLDSVLDRVADLAIVMGLTLAMLPINNFTLMIALLAAANSILVSYATHALRSIGAPIVGLRQIPATRDCRLFAVFIACLLQVPMLGLYYVALVPIPYLVAATWLAARAPSLDETQRNPFGASRRVRAPSPELPGVGQVRQDISRLLSSAIKLTLLLLILRLLRPAVSGIVIVDFGPDGVLTTGETLSLLETAVVIYFGYVILSSSKALVDRASEALVERIGLTRTTIERIATDALYVFLGLMLWAYSPQLSLIPYVGPDLFRIASLASALFLVLVLYDLIKRLYSVFRDAYEEIVERINSKFHSQ